MVPANAAAAGRRWRSGRSLAMVRVTAMPWGPVHRPELRSSPDLPPSVLTASAGVGTRASSSCRWQTGRLNALFFQLSLHRLPAGGARSSPSLASIAEAWPGLPILAGPGRRGPAGSQRGTLTLLLSNRAGGALPHLRQQLSPPQPACPAPSALRGLVEVSTVLWWKAELNEPPPQPQPYPDSQSTRPQPAMPALVREDESKGHTEPQ